MPRERTPPDLDHWIELYQAGNSVEQVARTVNRPPMTVYHWLRKRGVNRSRSAGTRLRWQAERDRFRKTAVARFQAGASILAIANELGISRPAVVSALQDVGLTSRDGSTANRLRFADPAQRGRIARSAHLAMGRGNADFADALQQLGVSVARERVIDHLNVDLAVGPLTIEIHRSSASPLAPRSRERHRLEHLLGRGWAVLYVWTSRCQIDWVRCADYVHAWLQELGPQPAPIGEYRVIRGCGELSAYGGPNLDQVAVVRSRHCCRHHA